MAQSTSSAVTLFLSCASIYCLTACLRLSNQMFALVSPPPTQSLAGSQVAIKCFENGRYLEVSSDGWVYASSFTHNKLAARFNIVPVSVEMLRALAGTREYHERSDTVGMLRWDMRQPHSGGWGRYSEPEARAGDGGLDDGAGYSASRSKEEAAIEEGEQSRRRIMDAAERGELGYVLLQSAYAGGYVEVVGRGEESEYVVRIGAEGRLSHRSLFLLEDDAIWSHAVGGYLNWRRPTASEPKQHVRAHGNTEPFGPLRTKESSARFQIGSPPPLVDVLGRLPCPADIPLFDWNWLLDAARAGACAGASLPTLRQGAAALARLEGALGVEISRDLADLVAAYRTVLLDRDWSSALDLQLTPCARRDLQQAGATPHEGSDGGDDFSWVDGESGRLVVDAGRCPRAAYSEVKLRPTPDDLLNLEMLHLQSLPSQSLASPAAHPPAATNASTNVGSFLSAALETDAVFVLCDYRGPGGAIADEGEEAIGDDAPPAAAEEEGEVAGDHSPPPPPPLVQNLIFRVSPRLQPLVQGDAAAAAAAAADSTPAAHTAAEAARADVPSADATATADADAAEVDDSDEHEARLSVLLMMIDATSRAHLNRMLPRSLSALRALRESGAVELYEFPLYSIVGYNSLPNMVPMLTGVDSETLVNMAPVGSYAAAFSNDDRYDRYDPLAGGGESP